MRQTKVRTSISNKHNLDSSENSFWCHFCTQSRRSIHHCHLASWCWNGDGEVKCRALIQYHRHPWWCTMYYTVAPEREVRTLCPAMPLGWTVDLLLGGWSGRCDLTHRVSTTASHQVFYTDQLHCRSISSSQTSNNLPDGWITFYHANTAPSSKSHWFDAADHPVRLPKSHWSFGL